MPNLESCSKCKSTKIIPRVRMVDRGEYDAAGDLTVIFKDTHQGVLRAWICGACGYVETYVDNPGELYDAYERSLSGRG
jgi:rubrerythrin